MAANPNSPISKVANDIYTNTGGALSGSALTTALGAALTLFYIGVVSPLYLYIAGKLNNSENHKTEVDHEEALVVKKFLSAFILSFATLFYIGIFKPVIGENPGIWDLSGNDSKEFMRLEGTIKVQCGYDLSNGQRTGCLSELTLQMAIIFVGTQYLNQVIEYLTP
jgi:hypothetical protein